MIGLRGARAFPINKNLWTSSYVVFTAGMAAYLFGLFYWIADVRVIPRWCRPFVVWAQRDPGLRALRPPRQDPRPPEGAGGTSVWAWLHGTLFASWLPPHPASVAFAITNVVLWYLVLRELDRRGLYFKV